MLQPVWSHAMPPNSTLIFASFRLDVADERLWRGPDPVRLTPKAFAVLRCLLERSGHLVTRDELFEVVWGTPYVTEAALAVCIREIRRALEDNAQQPRLIETVRGRGYRFLAEVEIRPSESQQPSEPSRALAVHQEPTDLNSPQILSDSMMAAPPPALPPEDQSEGTRCRACQCQNVLEAQFCMACGAPLSLFCPQCHQACPPASLYCSTCGYRLAPETSMASDSRAMPRSSETSSAEPPQPARGLSEGNRRSVTLLHLALANSQQLGLDTLHSLMQALYEVVQHDVSRYDGTIQYVKSTSILIVFGVPVVHEDHARRAVLAALSLRESITERHDSTPSGVTLAIRMGLHTGLVAVGGIAHEQGSTSMVGDTARLAIALQEHADAGMILCSEATARLVQGYCLMRPIEPLELQSDSTRLYAWEVRAARASRTRLEVEAEQGLTSFVGRTHELHSLNACLAQAQAGRGQMVFVVGEAGIGKSRLLLEFRQQLNDGEVTWLEGHALSFGQSIAFHLIIDMLKRAFRIEEDDIESRIIEKVEQSVRRIDEALQPLVPYMRYLLAVDPGDPTILSMEPQLRRAELFEALRHLLLRAAEVRPQILVFEDLHWMDAATEAFLCTIADSIPTSRVLCLFTYRLGYTHPFGERTYHTRLALPALSTADSVHMAQSMLHTRALPDELETLIIQKAEGNPFFVEEVVKSLQEVGAVQRIDEQYTLTHPIENIVVPDTIQDVLLARIDRLDEIPKTTLQLAAVIGREFTARLVSRLTNIQEGTQHYLQELKALELIYEKSLYPELAYMFKHALTQDVAYHSLLTQRRQELHRLIGLAIEDLYADRLAEHYEVLAYHFAQGEAWTQALAYLRQSAEKATQAHAIREAVSFYDQALDVVDRLDAAENVQIVMDIYKAKTYLYEIMSEFELARLEAKRLLSLAQTAGDRVQEGIALAEIGWASLWAHDFEPALTYARQAIETAQNTDAKEVLARGYLTMGIVHEVTGVLDQSQQEAEKALAISRSVGDAEHQSIALLVLGEYKNWQGQYAEAVQAQAEAIQMIRDHHLFDVLLYGLWAGGLSRTGQGDYEQALLTLNEGYVLSEKVGDEIWHNRILNSLGWLYGECGALEQAFDLNRRCAENARKRGDPELIANAELNLGDIFLAQGDLSSAQELLEGVHRLVQNPDTSVWMQWRYSMHLFISLGELWLRRGNPTQAETFADQCLDLATRSNSRKYIVKGHRLRGEVALAHRQFDVAEHRLRQALEVAQAIGNPTQLWKTHCAIGHLHTETKRLEQAQLAYRAACDVIDQVKANLDNPDLQAGLSHSLQIQQVYNLFGSCTPL